MDVGAIGERRRRAYHRMAGVDAIPEVFTSGAMDGMTLVKPLAAR